MTLENYKAAALENGMEFNDHVAYVTIPLYDYDRFAITANHYDLIMEALFRAIHEPYHGANYVELAFTDTLRILMEQYDKQRFERAVNNKEAK